MSVDAGTAGVSVSEVPLEIFNGTADGSGYPYYYVFIYGEYAGYYSTDIFNWPTTGTPGPMVAGPATYLQSGGEVFHTWPTVSTSPYYAHSGTSIGSDYPATDGYKYASYNRNIQYLSSAGVLYNASLTYPTQPSYMGDESISGLCGLYAGSFTDEFNNVLGYQLSNSTAPGGSSWGTYFYFGTNIAP